MPEHGELGHRKGGGGGGGGDGKECGYLFNP